MPIANLDTLLSETGGVQGLRVFVRADLNVPLSDGKITDDTRIRASVPTLKSLLSAGARVVLASHLGRPKGERKPELSLKPVAVALSNLLGIDVAFSEDCIGPEAEQAAAALEPGGLLLLENVRFHAEETKNDPEFAKALARLADVFVNDAFGTAHRAHASTVGIADHIERKAAGLLVEKEVANLNQVLEPEHPFACFLGGAKVSDKLAALDALATRADVLAIGGAMAYTFLLVQGRSVGKSLVERDLIQEARRIMEAAENAGNKVLLPVDHLAVPSLEKAASAQLCKDIPDNWLGVDLGNETAALYSIEAAKAKTIFWNGPMGIFETEAFSKGTLAVADAIATSSATSIVGGGDSLAAINQMGFADQITHLSTGGGASLEYIQGKVLPGIAALEGSK